MIEKEVSQKVHFDYVGLTDDPELPKKNAGTGSWYIFGPIDSEKEAKAWLAKMLRSGHLRDERTSGWKYAFAFTPTQPASSYKRQSRQK